MKKGNESKEKAIMKEIKKKIMLKRQFTFLHLQRIYEENEIDDDWLRLDILLRVASSVFEEAEEKKQEVKSFEKEWRPTKEALSEVGVLLSQLLANYPSKTIRAELRNDLKSKITEELWDSIKLVVPDKEIANSRFLIDTPTPNKIIFPNKTKFEFTVKRERGLKISTFSASSVGDSVADSQDAIGYSFNEWSNSGFTDGIISLSDGVTQSPLSGQWARYLCHYTTNIMPILSTMSESKEEQNTWLQAFRRSFIKTFASERKSHQKKYKSPFDGAMEFNNIRNHRERFDLILNENKRKLFNSASTFLQVKIEPYKFEWLSIGDCYLFCNESPIHVHDPPTNSPEVISSSQIGKIHYGVKNYEDVFSESISDKYSYLLLATDQAGYYNLKNPDTLRKIIDISNSPTEYLGSMKWKELAKDIWDSEDNKDDLSFVLVEFDKRFYKPDKNLVSKYLIERKNLTSDIAIKKLQDISEKEEMDIKLINGKSEKLKINPWETNRQISGGMATYFRLSQGKGIKLYSRHDSEDNYPKLRNQYRVSNKIMDDLQNLNMPNMEIVDKIDDLSVIAVLMNHLEGEQMSAWLQVKLLDICENEGNEVAEALIDKLEQNLFAVLDRLNHYQISHGDICAANILVDDKINVSLVDLDSIWAPHLTPTNERGKPGYHIKYQWKKGVDVVPFLIIILSIRFLKREITQFNEYITESEERLIFSVKDVNELSNAVTHYENPKKNLESLIESSKNGKDALAYLLNEMDNDPDDKLQFRKICLLIAQNRFNPDWNSVREFYSKETLY